MGDGGSGGGNDGGGDAPCYRYILVDRKPVPCPHLLCWARWYENPENIRVANSCIGNFEVSTVFLALDHNFGAMMGRDEELRPVLFETQTFVLEAGRRTGQGARERSCTWLEAEAAHARAVKVAHEITYPERYPALRRLEAIIEGVERGDHRK